MDAGWARAGELSLAQRPGSKAGRWIKRGIESSNMLGIMPILAFHRGSSGFGALPVMLVYSAHELLRCIMMYLPSTP